MKIKKYNSAFTLIELLVVIGLISVLAAGIGIALRGGNPGASLRAAQSTLVSTLAAARGQAALNQVNSMIIVDADPSSATFLRSIRVVVEKTTDNWTEVGGEIVLPQGVYVVPPNADITEVQLSSGTASGHVSNFFVEINSVAGVTGGASRFLKSAKFTTLGGLSGAPAGVGRILVASGAIASASNVAIDNTNAVRGLLISRYGVASLINDSATLSN